jgi:hypothetical protein
MTDTKQSNMIPEYLASFDKNPTKSYVPEEDDVPTGTRDFGTTAWVLQEPETDDDEPTYENVERDGGSDDKSDAGTAVGDDSDTTAGDGNGAASEDSGAAAAAAGDDGGGKWTKVQTRKKQFWNPVFDRPTSRRYDGKQGPVMMCPNRNQYGGCKTLLPCACGRVGHTARHNEHKQLRNQYLTRVVVSSN